MLSGTPVLKILAMYFFKLFNNQYLKFIVFVELNRYKIETAADR